MMQGAFSFACLNRSRTREAPTPTNISTNSEPDIEKKGTCASPATALASNVLPVPGGPTNITPFGILAPSRVNASGVLRKSTVSRTSIFASSSPATSLNVTMLLFSLSSKVAVDFPKLKTEAPPAPPAPPVATLRKKYCQMMTSNTSGITQLSILENQLVFFAYVTGTGGCGN